MSANELISLSATELADLIKSKKVSSEEITKAYLARIDSLDKKLGAFVSVFPEHALSQARAIDKKIAAGEKLGALAGVPLAPKDIYLTKGLRTTCSSKILENYIPPYNSTVIEKCLNADAVILGKTNMDEFAMGSSTETSAFGQTKNPWDVARTPGGSSGGSAAAVSADFCAASLGTDTGGSIRQPAAFCSIVGLKPTYGRVSRYGTIAFASSLDQMGPMTKTVEDSALLMNVISGHDTHDSTSIDCAVPDYRATLKNGVKGLRIGVPKEFFVEGLTSGVSNAVRASLKELEKLGAELVDVSLPTTPYAVATYYIIAPAEASSNLSRYDGVRYGLRAESKTLHEMYENTKGQGFGREVKRRILIGTYVLSAGYYDSYYLQAQRARTLMREDFAKAFASCDVIAGPVTPTTAFKLGEKTNDPIQMYLNDVLTISTNLAGLPGLSVPCGFDEAGLPVGLQLIGKAFDEETLLRTAYSYEQSAGWYKQKPKI